MAECFISVIIPVFNNTQFLRAAIQSVLAEKLTDLEIIVVDDGSTEDVLGSIRDLPVRTLRLEKNQGIPVARNAGIQAATGRYITFLDSDDVLCPNGLRWRVEWLQAHPEAVALAGRPAGVINSEGLEAGHFRHLLHKKYNPPSELTLEFFKTGNAYPVALWNYVFSRELMAKVGPMKEDLKIAEDLEYILRVTEQVAIPVVFRPVVFRRLHDHNISVESSNGHYALKPAAIAAVGKVMNSIGVEPTHWNLWETGYSDE